MPWALELMRSSPIVAAQDTPSASTRNSPWRVRRSIEVIGLPRPLPSAKKTAPCALGDGDGCWMLEPPFDGDGVKSLPRITHLPDDPHAVLAANARFYDRRGSEDPAPSLAKDFDQRAVVKLPHDARSNPVLLQPLLHRAPQRAALTREQERSAVKSARETSAVLGSELGRRKQGHSAVAE